MHTRRSWPSSSGQRCIIPSTAASLFISEIAPSWFRDRLPTSWATSMRSDLGPGQCWRTWCAPIRECCVIGPCRGFPLSCISPHRGGCKQPQYWRRAGPCGQPAARWKVHSDTSPRRPCILSAVRLARALVYKTQCKDYHVGHAVMLFTGQQTATKNQTLTMHEKLPHPQFWHQFHAGHGFNLILGTKHVQLDYWLRPQAVKKFRECTHVLPMDLLVHRYSVSHKSPYG